MDRQPMPEGLIEFPPSDPYDLMVRAVEDLEERHVGLHDVARLAGYDESRAAQLRAERRRDDDFPTVVGDGGRSQLHRLGDVVTWIGGAARFREAVELEPVGAMAFRLELMAAGIAQEQGADLVRRTVLALALLRIHGPLPVAGAAGLSPRTLLGLGPRARAGQRDAHEVDALLIEQPERFAALLGLTVGPGEPTDTASGAGSLPELLGPLTDDSIGRLAGAVEYLAAAALTDPSTSRERFAEAIDDVVRRVAAVRMSMPVRSSAALAVLLALATGADSNSVVAEPTAGECETLVLVGRTTDTREQVDLLGAARPRVASADMDIAAALVGRARLDLFGVESSPGWSQRVGSEGFGQLPDSVNRVVIDPGDADRQAIKAWLTEAVREVNLARRRSDRSIRVVIALPRAALAEEHIGLLPPTTVFVAPSKIAGGVAEPVLVWVHETDSDPSVQPILVDLRHRPPGETTAAQWLTSIRRLAAGDSVDRDRSSPPGHERLVELARPLLDAVRWFDRDGRVASSTSELPPPRGSVFGPPETDHLWSWTRALDAARPSIRSSTGAVAANRSYATALAQELERLLGAGPDDASPPDPVALPDRPDDSPAGVLYDVVTEDARRAVRRMVDRLSDEMRGKPRGRPRKSETKTTKGSNT